jgi:hypothetical protein
MLDVPKAAGVIIASAVTPGPRTSHGEWIESPLFDTCLLILTPLLTLPLVAAFFWQVPLLTIAAGLTLAFAHYSSTLMFYFWDENRDYFRARWFAFYAGPLIVAAIYFLVISAGVPLLLPAIFFLWNTWHVARQNSGILSIYRQRAGILESAQKNASNRAIIAASMFLALWNIDTHPDIASLFGLVSNEITRYLKLIAGIAAAIFSGQLIVVLLQRKSHVGVPEGLFLASSLAFFYPYLFIENSEHATFAMLLPHYVQYMALVWLLHRRKFGGMRQGAPAVLRRISSNLVILIPLLFTVGFSLYLMKYLFDRHGYQHVFIIFYGLIALEHFYLDGLIWSFKRPHVRQTIGTVLLRPPVGTST